MTFLLSGEEAQKWAEIIRAEQKRAKSQFATNENSGESAPSKKLESLKIDHNKSSNGESSGQDYIHRGMIASTTSIRQADASVASERAKYYGIGNNFNNLHSMVSSTPPRSSSNSCSDFTPICASRNNVYNNNQVQGQQRQNIVSNQFDDIEIMKIDNIS